MSSSFITIYSGKVPLQNTRITDVSKLTKTTGTSIEAPATIDELRTLAYVIQKKPLSIAGGRFSQKGQIAYPGA